MARIIADILDIQPLVLQRALDTWEVELGLPKHDIRVLGDMRARVRQAVDRLGLSSSDIDSRELYFALQGQALRDDALLAARYGVSNDDSADEMCRKVVAGLQGQLNDQSVWAMKTSSLKAVLKTQPPKHVMKALGLRSIDSMLKRNDPGEILVYAKSLETPEWNEKLHTKLKKVHVSDFDAKVVCPRQLSAERHVKLAKTDYPVSRMVSIEPLTGGLFVMPPRSRFNTDVLALAAAIVDGVEQLRKTSAYFRALSVRNDFGLQIYNVLTYGLSRASHKIAGIGWNSMYRGLVGNDAVLADIEQPYLSQHDFSHISMYSLLDQPGDAMSWGDLDYVLHHADGQMPVSFHVMDVVTNASNRLSYENQVHAYAKQYLADELLSRYMRDSVVAMRVMQRLQGEM